MKLRSILAVCAVLAVAASPAFAVSEAYIWTTDDYYGGGGRCCGSLLVSNDIGGGAVADLDLAGVASAGGGRAGSDNLFGSYSMNIINGQVGVLGNSRLGGGGYDQNVVIRYGPNGTGRGMDNPGFIDERFPSEGHTRLNGFTQLGTRVYMTDSVGDPGPGTIRSYNSDGSFGAVVASSGLSHTLGDVETVKVGNSRFLAVSESKGNDPKISIWQTDGNNPATKLSEVITLSTGSTNTDYNPRIVARGNKVYALQAGNGVPAEVMAFTVDSAGTITQDANSPLVPRSSGPNLGGVRDISINPLNGRIAVWGLTGNNGEVREFSPNTDAFMGNLATHDYGSRGISSNFFITPEPATLGLMVIGSLCMLRRRRRA